MNEIKPAAPLRTRALRALAIFVGAAVLGPALPALLFAAAAMIGARLPGPSSASVLTFSTVLSNAFSFVFVDGGEATAALSGLALALVVLLKGRLGPLAVTRTVAVVAALTAAWLVRAAPMRGAAALSCAFVVAAVVTARALYRLALSARVLPQE